MTTTNLPPCPLPEVTDDMVEFARTHTMIDSIHTFGELRSFANAIRLILLAAIPHWQPIELDEIKAGMRIRATVVWGDRIATYAGVAHHTGQDGDWLTEENRMLSGWIDPTTYEVDPTSIPDPDAELIEAIGKAIHDADKPADEWDEDPSVEAYRKLARVALAAIRAEGREQA